MFINLKIFFINKLATLLLLATDCLTVKDGCKNPEGASNHLFGGLMAVVMGIVAVIRMTRNMPRKITEAALYGSASLYSDTMIKGHHVQKLPPPSISGTEYMSMINRMAELEERMNILTKKPATMPQEKEELLNAAVNRVNTLEQELAATKKV